ncbi:MAG TPA: DNA phosphorothioation system sulfurtransferase DndC [Nocardioides sp.]|uniref:DNA phosphorothioation system sulfurtransferase DndC n=1 Tax=Nocardioides sp. TaxID=35761 RepID=UPI002C949639|nr:DNA phosphorothioation system sulfurtransferase DndC [Nocardioides sp.]HTW16173.1 DNA phosphorothioation system sulfurtransferase DndC [Nocardioides sp.]
MTTRPTVFHGPTEISEELREKTDAIVARLVERYEDPADNRPWIVAFSGGKDSTLVGHLVFEALARVRPSRRTRHVHLLSSDTLVETPAISSFVTSQLKAIADGARLRGLPMTTHLVRPELHETFWVRLIGYGYPAPNRTFRWCTERLKIKPTNSFILQQVEAAGEVLILLGSRIEESATRARSIRKHETSGSDINPHSILKSAWVWAPIRDLTTEEVWEYLALTPSPWGGNHRQLQVLYKEANSGECAIVMDETTKPCGNSRFGCWTCTVVDRDKSIEGFIGSGRAEYAGMAEMRDWLIELRDNPEDYREPVRRNGRPGNGPLKLSVRRDVLERLLSLQDLLGEELISEEEVALIKQVWVSDGLIDDGGALATLEV